MTAVKGKYSYIRIMAVILVTLVSAAVCATTITVTTDRDPAILSESFVMTFESDGTVDDDPDFSPLNRDFQVLSTGESSNMTIINGKVSSSKSWTLNVIARHTGTLRIPAIAFGNDRSTPATVNVVKQAPGNTSSNDREIFIEADATPKDPYVQSEVIYTIRLFRSVATANASLSDPPNVTGATAVVEKIGDDRSYDTRRGGKLYGVVERRYAIYPQGSGNLTIEPVVFQGQTSNGMSFFNNPFGRQPRTIVVQSDPIGLKVRAIPQTFTGGQWLPAREITLTEEWSQYPLKFKLDEPLTRTLTLTAKGLTSSQLPELPGWQSADFKQYPDQPKLEDDKESTGVIGKRVEKIAMIPGRPGKYTLPEVNIPWWNTVRNKMEYATLPERQIEVVAPATGTNANNTDTSQPAVANNNLSDINKGTVNPRVDTTSGKPAEQESDYLPKHLWQWLCLLLFVIWIVTLIIWRFSKKQNKESEQDNGSSVTLRAVIKELKQACMDNNPSRSKEKLLLWGRLAWPDLPPASIGEIANRCTDMLAVEIRLLNDALYSRNTDNWQGKELWREFEKEVNRIKVKPVQDRGKLEPLFKI